MGKADLSRDVLLPLVAAARVVALVTNPDAPRIVRKYQERVTRMLNDYQAERQLQTQIQRWEDDGGAIQ